jgi:hypothetical protein
MKFFAKVFDPSTRAALGDGPKHGTPTISELMIKYEELN